MKKRVALLAIPALLSALPAGAGPEKIAFPDAFAAGVLYATVDRPDIKQYRELYSTAEAVNLVKQGKPIPSGTVLTLVQYAAQLDAAGNPVPAWRTFWSLFGASNQLLAALTLLGITVWLWRTRRVVLLKIWKAWRPLMEITRRLPPGPGFSA